MATGALTDRRRGAVAAIPSDTGLAFVDTEWGRVSLTLHRSFEDARDVWESLQRSAAVTHAQSYACAKLWFEEVSKPAGARAAIVVGRSQCGSLLFVWPLEIVKRHGLGVLQWIGQDHANYNMGLHDPQFARKTKGEDVKRLLKAAASMAGNVSLACLRNQPFEWEGTRNPLALISHQQAPNLGYAVLLDRDFDTLYRNRFSGRTRNSLRRKERKLREYGELEFGWARDDKQCKQILAKFFRQKTKWFAKNGIADPFTDPARRRFYEKLATLPDGEPGRLEVGYLKVGETIAATFHGAQIDRRFHILLSSIDSGDTERWSPGILLMREQISETCARGCLRYDLGCGQAPHKSDWCDDAFVLFDSYIAFDLTGYALTIPFGLTARAKGWIKNSALLWAIARRIRRLNSPEKATYETIAID